MLVARLPARRPRPHRHARRLRARRLRRVHGARRRRGDALVPHVRRPGSTAPRSRRSRALAPPTARCTRSSRPSARSTACSAASARPGMLMATVELLARHPAPDRRRDPRRARRQPVPLHRLPEHRQRRLRRRAARPGEPGHGHRLGDPGGRDELRQAARRPRPVRPPGPALGWQERPAQGGPEAPHRARAVRRRRHRHRDAPRRGPAQPARERAHPLDRHVAARRRSPASSRSSPAPTRPS